MSAAPESDIPRARRVGPQGVRVRVARARAQAEKSVARLVAGELVARPSLVLGLPTGGTPAGVYRELVRLHREEHLSFGGASTFNVDEYLGLRADHPASFRAEMERALFDHVDVRAERVHFPDVDGGVETAHESAARYESAIAAAGGIDLLLLGVGRNGHVGFNEPGSPRDSRTRLVELHADTRRDAVRAFGGLARVPTHAITMGIATLCDARRIVVLAFGAAKRDVVQRMLLDPIDAATPVTFVRAHSNVEVWLDEEAAAGLSEPP
ncbi:MAG: glucosamine-6-phosphate deaminase [Planctomycetota bacterium]